MSPLPSFLQIFEGVDYSDKDARQAEMDRLRKLALLDELHASMGKRERRAVSQFRAQTFTPVVTSTKHVQPPFTLPRMEVWQFYNETRIVELYEKELAHARKCLRLQQQVHTHTQPHKRTSCVAIWLTLRLRMSALLITGVVGGHGCGAWH